MYIFVLVCKVVFSLLDEFCIEYCIFCIVHSLLSSLEHVEICIAYCKNLDCVMILRFGYWFFINEFGVFILILPLGTCQTVYGLES